MTKVFFDNCTIQCVTDDTEAFDLFQRKSFFAVACASRQRLMLNFLAAPSFRGESERQRPMLGSPLYKSVINLLQSSRAIVPTAQRCEDFPSCGSSTHTSLCLIRSSKASGLNFRAFDGNSKDDAS